MDIFFVLSGYIITSILWNHNESASVAGAWLKFIGKRAKRLYPPLLGLALTVPFIYLFVPGAPASFASVCHDSFLVLVQGASIWRGAGSGTLGPFGHTWSLAVEWYFYLAWPLVVYLLKRRGISPRNFAIGITAAAGVIFLLALFQGSDWFYYGPVARFPELLIGGACAMWIVSKPEISNFGSARIRSILPSLAIIVMALYVVLGPDPVSPLFRFVGLPLTVTSTLLFIVVGRDSKGIFIRLLNARPMALLGRVSYSFYLWHYIPIALMKGAFPTLPQVVLAGIGVTFAIIATAVSYLLLEKPFMRAQSASLVSATSMQVSDRQHTVVH